MTPKLLVPDPAVKETPAGKSGTSAAVVVRKRKAPRPAAVPAARGPEPLDEARPVGQLQKEAYGLARLLDSTESIKDRIAIYRHAGKRLVFLAARLWPRLMPMLNGEFEFIALTSADLY